MAIGRPAGPEGRVHPVGGSGLPCPIGRRHRVEGRDLDLAPRVLGIREILFDIARRQPRVDLVARAPAAPGGQVVGRETGDGPRGVADRVAKLGRARPCPLEQHDPAAEDARGLQRARNPRGTLPKSSPTTTAPARAASIRTTASIASRGICT
jgi:hypothetical protein